MPDVHAQSRAEALAYLRAGHERLLGIHRTHPSPNLQRAIDILGSIIGEEPQATTGELDGPGSDRLWMRVTRRRGSAAPASQLTS